MKMRDFLILAWNWFWVGVRVFLAVRFFAAGGLALLFGLSECVAAVLATRGLMSGRLDKSVLGCCVPLLHMCPLTFRPCSGGYPVAVLWLFLFGCQVWVRLTLGRCCTVASPVFCRVVMWGPYKYIRHPLALCEMAMSLVFVMRYPSTHNVVVLVIAWAAAACAVLIEESFLMKFQGYQEYAGVVRSRLVPGLL